MTRKGIIEEIFSKAKFANEINLYYVAYRDFERVREVELQEFIEESENFQKIPSSRITSIRKNNTILFEKNPKKVE
ncbi:MAG: DUF504 domain-containing protein [Nitrosopumilaceae archaeon]|jgi:hypothetical protein